MAVKDSLVKIETHKVPLLDEKQRLQEYATGIFTNLVSRSGVKKAIKKGLVFINSEKGQTGDWIYGGEMIELYRESETQKPNVELDLKVLFEDAYLAIINKPAGVLVSGNKRLTVGNALLYNLKKSNRPDALNYPEPIHRLDFPTTGALLVGKTTGILPKLNALFEHRRISKTYLAVTIGEMKDSGVNETPVDDKPASSEYEKLAAIPSDNYGKLNLLKLTPQTGRRHQLRKHMAEIGNPIFGDKLYGAAEHRSMGKGLYLHASSLSFKHPETGKDIYVTAPLPKKFLKLFPEAITR